MAAAVGKRRVREHGLEFERHAKYLAKKKRLMALAREAIKEQEANAEIIVKYSPYSRPIDGVQAPEIQKATSHHQMKLKKMWNRRHPEVIVVNSRDMMPKVPDPTKVRSETKVKSQPFVHTTRLAAWRATRFKGKGARSGKQGSDGRKPLQGLTYADFLREVATMRKQGDASAVESQHGGIQRPGGMPLIFPYVPKKYDQVTKDRMPVWMDLKAIQEKQAKEAERQKELKKQEREQELQELRKKERARQRDKKKSVKMQDSEEPRRSSPCQVSPYPMGDYSATSLSSVCSWCSLVARRPPAAIWIDPNILKAPRTKNSLWKRTVETGIQTDPIVPPRSGSAQREDAWRFLQDADPSETSLQAESSTIMSPEYDADQYDPELSVFLREVIRDSLHDSEIVKPAGDSATLGKVFVLKDFGRDSKQQDVYDKPTFADVDQALDKQQVPIDVDQTNWSPEKTSWSYPETGVAQSTEEPTTWPYSSRIGDQGTPYPSGVVDKETTEEYTQVTPPGSVSPPWQFRDYHVPPERRPSEEEGLIWPFPPGKPDKWPQWPFPIARKKMLPRPTSCPPSILRQYSEDEIPTWPFKPDKPREEMPEWPFPLYRHALGVRWPCGFSPGKSEKIVERPPSCPPSLLRNQYSEDEIPTWPFQPGKPQKMHEWPFPLGKYPFGVRWPCGIFPAKSEKAVPRAASCPPAPIRRRYAYEEDPNWPFQPGKPRKVMPQWPFPRGRHPLGVRWPCGLFPEGSDKILPRSRSRSCPPRLKRQYSIDEEPNWPFQPGRPQELQQWPFPWGRHPLGIRWPCGLFPAELDTGKDEDHDNLSSFDEALLEDGLIVSCDGKETDLPSYISNVILDGCQQYQREEGLVEMPMPPKKREVQWKEQQLYDEDALVPISKQKDKLTEDMVEDIGMEEKKQPVVSDELKDEAQMKEEAQIAISQENEDEKMIFEQEADVAKDLYGGDEPHRDVCLENLEHQAQVKICIDQPSVEEFGKVQELFQQDVYEEPASAYKQDVPTDFYQAPTTVEGQVLVHIDQAPTEAVPDFSPENTTWPYPATGITQSAEDQKSAEENTQFTLLRDIDSEQITHYPDFQDELPKAYEACAESGEFRVREPSIYIHPDSLAKLNRIQKHEHDLEHLYEHTLSTHTNLPSTFVEEEMRQMQMGDYQKVPDLEIQKKTLLEETGKSEEIVLNELSKKQEVVVPQETRLEDDTEKHDDAEKQEVTKLPEEEKIRKEKEDMQQQKKLFEETMKPEPRKKDEILNVTFKLQDVKKEEDINMTEAIKQTQAEQEEKLDDIKKHKGGEDTEKEVEIQGEMKKQEGKKVYIIEARKEEYVEMQKIAEKPEVQMHVDIEKQEDIKEQKRVEKQEFAVQLQEVEKKEELVMPVKVKIQEDLEKEEEPNTDSTAFSIDNEISVSTSSFQSMFPSPSYSETGIQTDKLKKKPHKKKRVEEGEEIESTSTNQIQESSGFRKTEHEDGLIEAAVVEMPMQDLQIDKDVHTVPKDELQREKQTEDFDEGSAVDSKQEAVMFGTDVYVAPIGYQKYEEFSDELLLDEDTKALGLESPVDKTKIEEFEQITPSPEPCRPEEILQITYKQPYEWIPPIEDSQLRQDYVKEVADVAPDVEADEQEYSLDVVTSTVEIQTGDSLMELSPGLFLLDEDFYQDKETGTEDLAQESSKQVTGADVLPTETFRGTLEETPSQAWQSSVSEVKEEERHRRTSSTKYMPPIFSFDRVSLSCEIERQEEIAIPGLKPCDELGPIEESKTQITVSEELARPTEVKEKESHQESSSMPSNLTFDRVPLSCSIFVPELKPSDELGPTGESKAQAPVSVEIAGPEEGKKEETHQRKSSTKYMPPTYTFDRVSLSSELEYQVEIMDPGLKPCDALCLINESEPKAPKSEPKAPKSEPEVPQSEPEAPRSEPKAPKSEPKAPTYESEVPKSEPETPKYEMEAPKSEPEAPKYELEAPKSEPETPKYDLEAPKSAPEAPKSEPKAPTYESEVPKSEPKTPKYELDAPKSKPEAPKSEPKAPKSEEIAGPSEGQEESHQRKSSIKYMAPVYTFDRVSFSCELEYQEEICDPRLKPLEALGKVKQDSKTDTVMEPDAEVKMKEYHDQTPATADFLTEESKHGEVKAQVPEPKTPAQPCEKTKDESPAKKVFETYMPPHLYFDRHSISFKQKRSEKIFDIDMNSVKTTDKNVDAKPIKTLPQIDGEDIHETEAEPTYRLPKELQQSQLASIEYKTADQPFAMSDQSSDGAKQRQSDNMSDIIGDPLSREDSKDLMQYADDEATDTDDREKKVVRPKILRPAAERKAVFNAGDLESTSDDRIETRKQYPSKVKQFSDRKDSHCETDILASAASDTSRTEEATESTVFSESDSKPQIIDKPIVVDDKSAPYYQSHETTEEMPLTYKEVIDEDSKDVRDIIEKEFPAGTVSAVLISSDTSAEKLKSAKPQLQKSLEPPPKGKTESEQNAKLYSQEDAERDDEVAQLISGTAGRPRSPLRTPSPSYFCVKCNAPKSRHPGYLENGIFKCATCFPEIAGKISPTAWPPYAFSETETDEEAQSDLEPEEEGRQEFVTTVSHLPETGQEVTVLALTYPKPQSVPSQLNVGKRGLASTTVFYNKDI